MEYSHFNCLLARAKQYCIMARIEGFFTYVEVRVNIYSLVINHMLFWKKEVSLCCSTAFVASFFVRNAVLIICALTVSRSLFHGINFAFCYSYKD